jgi:hypothetical protein
VHWQQDGEVAHVSYFSTCGPCMRAEMQREAAEQAVFWGAQADLRPDDPHSAENARRVAEAIRERLVALEVEPDAATSAFIARYAT